jgi:pimeloyl-ACP methyl ester carboxylesterase
MSPPETRYAKSGDVSIAYQVSGSGPLDLIFVPGFVSNLDVHWETPGWSDLFARLGRFSRLVRFDKRGTGLSDRVPGIPNLDVRMDDVRAVMDAAGLTRAAIFGVSEGGPMSLLFAATYPQRVQALVLYGSFARHPSLTDKAVLARNIEQVERLWGNRRVHGPQHAADQNPRRDADTEVGLDRTPIRQPVGRHRNHADEQRDRCSRHPARGENPDPRAASNR